MSGGALLASTPELDPPATDPSRGATVSAWSAVLVLLVVVAAAPFGGVTLLERPAAIVVDGPVEQLIDGSWRTAPPGTQLEVGAELRIRDEHGVLRVPAGRITLAPGSDVTLEDTSLALARGALLGETDRLVDVTSGAVRVSARGAWRVDLTSFARVGVYDGGAAVAVGDAEAVSVGRLEQLGLPDGGVAAEPEPLRYLRADPWDARLLGDAIAVDRFVERLQRMIDARYGQLGQTRDFYADFAVADEVVDAVMADENLLTEPPALALTRIVVVTALADGAGLSPEEASSRTARLRRDGAQWGLILARHDIAVGTLRDVADAALRERSSQVTEGTAAPVQTSTEPAPPSPEEVPEAPPPPGDEPAQPDQPPGEDPDDDEEEEGTELPGPDPVTDPVEDAIDSVGDLLPDLPDPPAVADAPDSSAPSDLPDPPAAPDTPAAAESDPPPEGSDPTDVADDAGGTAVP